MTTSIWKSAARPKWLQAVARKAVVKLEGDEIIIRIRTKYRVPKSQFKVLLALAALAGAEEAVRRLHAELNNPFEED